MLVVPYCIFATFHETSFIEPSHRENYTMKARRVEILIVSNILLLSQNRAWPTVKIHAIAIEQNHISS
jgi:hypothetical protein